MLKKLQINAIPQGKAKLNSTSDGAGCYFTQCLSPGWGMQLAADPGHPVAGLGAVNVCGECHPGSTWSPGGQRLGGVRDFHQFSLKKAPALPATSHPAMGHYSSTLHPHPALLLWAMRVAAAVRSGPVSASLAWWAGAGAGASKGAGAPSPPRGFGCGISDPQGAEGGSGGDLRQGRSCPFALLPGGEIEPQDVSAACVNAMLAERNDCLLSRAHRKISFPEHLLI